MNVALLVLLIKEALQSIWVNKLRTGITIFIIAFGITALVGVLTSIDGIRYWLQTAFTTLGTNTFRVQNRFFEVRIGGRHRFKRYAPITYLEATQFQTAMNDRGYVASVFVNITFRAQAKYQSKKTPSNILLKGVDHFFLITEGYELEEGRMFQEEDLALARNVVVIGAAVKEALFPYGSPVGRIITIGKKQFEVVGVLKERGTMMGSGGDKVLWIPITTARKLFLQRNRSYAINVFVPDANMLLDAVEEAIGIFRIIRRLDPGEENNFSISLSDSFVNRLMENLRLLTWSAIAIAIITLLGALIGLMNILLVSVTERTKEIGIRKALGATLTAIRLQFFTESIIIGQVGGVIGMLLGILVGNILGWLLNIPFLIPWRWMLMASAVCLLVSILAGVYPAQKAARLHPVEALQWS